MSARRRDFAFVEAQLRRKTFGVLSTVRADGSLQTTGILYGVSPPGRPLRIYLLTDRDYVKARNVARNPEVSFLVPYPHHWLPFVPASCISFSGTAEIAPAEDPQGGEAFAANRMLRSNLELGSRMPGSVFIRIRPKGRMLCYGVGIGLFTIARKPDKAGYAVEIPEDRL